MLVRQPLKNKRYWIAISSKYGTSQHNMHPRSHQETNLGSSGLVNSV